MIHLLVIALTALLGLVLTSAGAAQSIPRERGTAQALVAEWEAQLASGLFDARDGYDLEACRDWSMKRCVKGCVAECDTPGLDCRSECEEGRRAAAAGCAFLKLETQMAQRWNEVEPALLSALTHEQHVDEAARLAARFDKGSDALSQVFASVLTRRASYWITVALSQSLARSTTRGWLHELAAVEPPDQESAQQIDQLLATGLTAAVPGSVVRALVRRHHAVLQRIAKQPLLAAIEARLEESPGLDERRSLAQALAERFVRAPADYPAHIAAIQRDPEVERVFLTHAVARTTGAPKLPLTLYADWAAQFAGTTRAWALAEWRESRFPELGLCRRLDPNTLPSTEAHTGLLWLMMNNPTASRWLLGPCDAYEGARWELWLVSHAGSPLVERSTLLTLLQLLGREPLTGFLALSRPDDDDYQARLVGLACERLEKANEPHEHELAAMTRDAERYGDAALGMLVSCARRDKPHKDSWQRTMSALLPRLAPRITQARLNGTVGSYLHEQPERERERILLMLKQASDTIKNQPLFPLALSVLHFSAQGGDEARELTLLRQLDDLLSTSLADGQPGLLPQTRNQSRDLVCLALSWQFSDVAGRDRELKKFDRVRKKLETQRQLQPDTAAFLDQQRTDMAHWVPFVFSL